jgi:hypothetical protein
MATTTTTPLPEHHPEAPGPHKLRGAFRHPPRSEDDWAPQREEVAPWFCTATTIREASTY